MAYGDKLYQECHGYDIYGDPLPSPRWMVEYLDVFNDAIDGHPDFFESQEQAEAAAYPFIVECRKIGALKNAAAWRIIRIDD